jgi:hypothetical protein
VEHKAYAVAIPSTASHYEESRSQVGLVMVRHILNRGTVRRGALRGRRVLQENSSRGKPDSKSYDLHKLRQQWIAVCLNRVTRSTLISLPGMPFTDGILALSCLSRNHIPHEVATGKHIVGVG